MRRLAVFANVEKPAARQVLERLLSAAQRAGLDVLALDATATLMPSCPSVGFSDLGDEVDAVVVLGGDGTMLAAVRKLADQDLPLIGVNIGSLGFMTSLAQERVEEAISRLAAGDYKIGLRALADATVMRGGDVLGEYHALNDVVLTRGSSSRMVRLSVAIDGVQVNDYACDGLVLSTPTGSTGHSLSAGGPIVMPIAPVFVLSLICPHTLGSRPLVVPDTCEVAMTVQRGEHGTMLSIDGQVQVSLAEGDVVCVRRGPTPVRFVHLPDFDYWEVLRRKLHWRGASII